jgi:hypothetical protein
MSHLAGNLFLTFLRTLAMRSESNFWMKRMQRMLQLVMISITPLTPSPIHPMPTLVVRTIDLTRETEWCTNECAQGAKVAFAGDHTMVITFLHPETDSNGLATDRKTFRALAYNAETGELAAQLRWACCSHPITDTPQLIPVHNGGFLVRPENGKVVRYSSDLKPLKETTFPGPPGGYWDLKNTPGGQLAFLVSGPGTREQFSQTWIDVDTLEVVSTRKGLYNFRDPAAEDAVAVLDWDKNPPFRRFIILEERGKTGRLLTYGHTPCLFVTNDHLLSSDKAGFSVVNRSGETLFTGDLTYAGRPTLWSDRSLSGNRFAILDFSRAIPLVEKRGFFDWNFTAKVYDMKSKDKIAEFKLGTQDARTVSLALSPNGSRLAVLTDSKCDILELPQP